MGESEIVFSYRKSHEGGYESRALGHSIFTQAKTMDELNANVQDAIAGHFPDRNPLPAARLLEVRPQRRILGSAKGQFTVLDDFNDRLPKKD